MPPVTGAFTVGKHFVVPVEVLSIDAKVHVRSQVTAIAGTGALLELSTACSFHVHAFAVGRTASDDVDHAIDGIGAPQRAARTADDFDAGDVFEKVVLDVPEDAGEQGGI